MINYGAPMLHPITKKAFRKISESLYFTGVENIVPIAIGEPTTLIILSTT